jgi:DNA-binding XRE family transcriptional regulator
VREPALRGGVRSLPPEQAAYCRFVTTATTSPLRSARLARSLSQARAAAMIGVGRHAWIEWEAGRQLPEARHLLAVGDLFDCDPRTIFPRDDNGPDASRAAVRGADDARRDGS